MTNKKDISEEIESFYLNKEEPFRSCLLALREIILRQDENITETRKWGMPCFCFKKKMFCYLWMEKTTHKPYILMVEGKHLNFPGLESGNRTRMKIYKIDPNKDIPIDSVEELLNMGLDLYRMGVIKIK
ncbi:DUF1801 domain-containing protein [Membranihabitans maritimus]|uniref:DUF1801 domain-containing protein n=1 Tax=Membranihabitans maritimus TaxID=2904244 RepID=UPI001F2AEEAE|nr:DUF1801 domain-containing protein [Membranihabitans maritimus]